MLCSIHYRCILNLHFDCEGSGLLFIRIPLLLSSTHVLMTGFIQFMINRLFLFFLSRDEDNHHACSPTDP